MLESDGFEDCVDGVAQPLAADERVVGHGVLPIGDSRRAIWPAGLVGIDDVDAGVALITPVRTCLV